MTSPPRGSADFLQLGTWNAQCSICGKKMKATNLVRNWQGLYRCPPCNEPRQPQDFVRAPTENAVPAFVQPFSSIFVGLCDPNAISALTGYATADCAVADYVSPLFDPAIPPGD